MVQISDATLVNLGCKVVSQIVVQINRITCNGLLKLEVNVAGCVVQNSRGPLKLLKSISRAHEHPGKQFALPG